MNKFLPFGIIYEKFSEARNKTFGLTIIYQSKKFHDAGKRLKNIRKIIIIFYKIKIFKSTENLTT